MGIKKRRISLRRRRLIMSYPLLYFYLINVVELLRVFPFRHCHRVLKTKVAYFCILMNQFVV